MLQMHQWHEAGCLQRLRSHVSFNLYTSIANCFLLRRTCFVENRFHPVVGDASPLMWSSEDRRLGEGGAQRDGARRARSC